jgi:hypothetical protein
MLKRYAKNSIAGLCFALAAIPTCQVKAMDMSDFNNLLACTTSWNGANSVEYLEKNGACAYRKSHPAILMMRSAQDRAADDIADPVNAARDRASLFNDQRVRVAL